MYGYAYHKKETVTVASAASYSTAIDIQEFNKVSVEVPELGTLMGANTSKLFVNVAQSSTDTFRRLKHQAVSGVSDWEVPATSGNYNVICPVEGYNYMQVVFGTAATDGVTVYVHKMK